MDTIKKQANFREKAYASQGYMLTYDDVLCRPGYTDFHPTECDISTHLGPYDFYSPFITAAMDTVTEDEMAIAMALHGGLGVVHRNCGYERQLEIVKKVKRARNFIIEDVATVSKDITINELRQMMVAKGISGFPVVDANTKLIGIVTERDLPYDEGFEGKVSDVMTRDPICLPPHISREEGLAKLYEIRKEKIPLVDNDGTLVGLITKKDLKPNYPHTSKDEKGRLLCGLGCSPFLPKDPHKLQLLKEISDHVDIMMTDVAEFYKRIDMQGAKAMMESLNSKFVLGNIGTYEAAEAILTMDYPEDKLIGLKTGMGSGSICSTAIQTGVGAPTFYATAEVADAIKDYNPKIGLIADGGFKYPGDFVKASAVGADMFMSGHFFAGCTESPGYIDTVNGRKVKVYRGMGSAEARSVGSYADDRYIKESKKLAEGVSGYTPFRGPLKGVLNQLEDGLLNGLIYSGAKSMTDAYKIQIARVTPAGSIEARPHDLLH
ncbi:MAG: IMP dehydrogenase [Promethearchaeota archaeon]